VGLIPWHRLVVWYNRSMSAATIDIDNLLEARDGFRSGRPCLRGTGITVHTIVAYHLQGMAPDEILDGFPHATLAGIHAALAYYYAHEAEIEADYAADVAFGEDAIRRLDAEVV
jgi:uncharacterized protein (DUF433 family)